MQIPLLSSGLLNIKDAHCAECKDLLKKSYHIISCYRVMDVQKGRYGHPNFLFSKEAKFAENIRIDLIRIYINSFFSATLSFPDIVNFSNYCVPNFTSVLGNFFFFKNGVYLKRCTMFWSELLYSWVFFCAILSLLSYCILQ